MEVSEEQQKRIFISNKDVPDWGYKTLCTLFTIDNDPDSISRHATGLTPTIPATFRGLQILTFYAADASCIDCTLRGTNKKPVSGLNHICMMMNRTAEQPWRFVASHTCAATQCAAGFWLAGTTNPFHPYHQRSIKDVYKATTIRPRVKFALALSAALTILSVSFAQDQAKELAASFDIYQQQNLKEKIFVHTDKNYYLAGEAIWFKLYVTDAGHNRPLDFSKVAYVEILDTANKAVLQAKVALQHAGGSGSFLVPLNINSGNYTFRAYTNWMKNAGLITFFSKEHQYCEHTKSVTTDPVAVPVKYDVQFFPKAVTL